MNHRLLRAAPVLLVSALALAACQTAPAANAGFLQSYEGLQTKEGTLRVSVRDRRDDTAAQAVERVFIEPSILTAGAADGIAPADVAMVLGEVDRQVCYEVSERFTVVPAPAADAARVRAAVTRIVPTEPTGSGAAAVANFFIPGPIGVRAPGTTGTLAAEAELIAVGGTQVAALAWARSANVVGMDTPSLSRVGDALQFAELSATRSATVSRPRTARSATSPRPTPANASAPATSLAASSPGR